MVVLSVSYVTFVNCCGSKLSCNCSYYLQSRRYKGLKPGELPTCESLKDTIARALPFWNDVIAPEIKAGKNVIIAAHGNSLRGIVKHLEGEHYSLQVDKALKEP